LEFTTNGRTSCHHSLCAVTPKNTFYSAAVPDSMSPTVANLIQNETLKNNLLLNIVDVSASIGAFVGTVCLIAVRLSVSGRTGCRRCGTVG